MDICEDEGEKEKEREGPGRNAALGGREGKERDNARAQWKENEQSKRRKQRRRLRKGMREANATDEGEGMWRLEERHAAVR